jgi:hypothetical protein
VVVVLEGVGGLVVVLVGVLEVGGALTVRETTAGRFRWILVGVAVVVVVVVVVGVVVVKK